MPQNTINVVFSTSICPQNGVCGYAFVLIDPQAGLIEDTGFRNGKPWRIWYDCLKDILSRVPKNSTLMVHVRCTRLVSALVSNKPLSTDKPEYIKEREKIYKIIERNNLLCYAHNLFLPADGLEQHTKEMARKIQRKVSRDSDDTKPF